MLKDPLVPAPKMAGAPVERVPFAAQEREYRLQAKDGKPIDVQIRVEVAFRLY